MQTITITIDDDGQITVEADGREPYACSSPDECLDYVEGVMRGEEPAEEAGEMQSGDMAEMWNQEAAKRPQNPNLMT